MNATAQDQDGVSGGTEPGHLRLVLGTPATNSRRCLRARMAKILCAVKGGDFLWVQSPPGDGSLQPVAIGA
jgi:hypothetical protein